MKNDDYLKTKKELKQEIDQSESLLVSYDEKRRMAKVNRIGYKLAFINVQAGIIYAIITTLLVVLGLPQFLLTMPIQEVVSLMVGVPLAIGVITNYVVEKKCNTKKRYQDFSNAKTEVQKLEDEIKYSVEQEKVNNRILTKMEICDKLEIDQSYSLEYIEKNRSKYADKKLVQENVNKLTSDLNKKYQELDVLSSKKVLNERCFKVRNGHERRMTGAMAAIACGAIMMMAIDVPIMIVKEAIDVTVGLSAVFTPLLVGTVVGTAYVAKASRDAKKVFKKVNKDLGDNALKEKISVNDYQDEKYEIDMGLEKVKKEITYMESELKEQQRILDSINEELEIDSNEKSKTYESLQHEYSDNIEKVKVKKSNWKPYNCSNN